ncbi:MopE-related protein [Nocardioides panaciterrulae]|uniref:Uncharacterized protein n=1 Tax=Nocardioides panaciterrulae TaxID=661492 RepID=A0A7Y9E8J5_9ACTN|nr:hypothetical protein [Nocardioides panaciterrulae]NYD43204.1 hypothetical protein [Nocardioides panaciterrulae]
MSLPTCVAWRHDPIGKDTDPPTHLALCGGDSDNDGWDDEADCAPYDSSINPGAVDVPNDGIDQNCDGHDLVVGTGVIQVTLLWNNDDDLDLHVTDPGGTRIWYGNTGPTATGGRLDRDDNVFVCGYDSEPGGVENTVWDDGASPLHGTYTVEVYEYHRCAEPANWTVQIRVDGTLVKTENGSGYGRVEFDY